MYNASAIQQALLAPGFNAAKSIESTPGATWAGGNPYEPVNSIVPVVVERDPATGMERATDVYSALVQQNIIMCKGTIETNMANAIVAQIYYLNKLNPTKPIVMYIQSQGGCVHSGLAIRDAMEFVSNPIITVGMGMMASMGAYLLTCGDERVMMPRAQCMVHQVSSGARGLITDMDISLDHSRALNDLLMTEIAANIGTTKEELINPTTKFNADRDMWLRGDLVLPKSQGGIFEKGIVDKIQAPQTKHTA